jgi:ArsR family transcriptional regulator, arsenate/arsenite/antimonite-responsive transcriptional repressor
MEMAKSSVVAATDTTTSCCTPFLTDEILDDQTAATLAAGFAALADPTRLRVLSILASAEAGEVCVCDLTGPVGKSQPTVSHHLKLLAEAGLVTGDKRGRWVWYRIVPERVAELRAMLALP